MVVVVAVAETETVMVEVVAEAVEMVVKMMKIKN